ncbi:MAG: CoA-binding protein [Bacteroidetes bacterium]|nr:MAG: CoA-binding protein [Bacteroidota bacterium]
MSKKTLVLGASPTPVRYAYKAVKRLLSYGHEVVAIGKVEAEIDSVKIIKEMVDILDLHTVTMYLNPEKQEPYLDYIIKLKPKRIIFNPGSYNPKLEKLAKQAGIQVMEDCTLVMLDMDDF